MADRTIQYYVYHRRAKIIKGPFNIVDDEHRKALAFSQETDKCYRESDPSLAGDPAWVGGTLDKILRDPGVDRQDIARALGLKKD